MSIKAGDVIDRLACGRLSRRAFGRLLASAGVGLAAMPLLSRAASADAAVNYFTWTGYDVPEMFPAFIEAHGEGPTINLFADMEEALQKLRAGFQSDVVHPCVSEIGRWREADVVQPIDVGRLKNWPDLFPGLTTMPGVVENGTQWLVPCDWGNTSVIYRTDLVEPAEPSWGVLWDERYAGRLSVGNEIADTWLLTAVYTGVADPFNPTDADLQKVGDAWRRQKPLLRFYWEDNSQMEQAMASGEVVAASAWNASVATLKAQGIPVAYLEPKEGMLCWSCGLVLYKNAQNLDEAYELIDAIISPETGEFLLTAYGYGHSNEKAFERVSDEVLAGIGIPRDPSELLSKGWFSRGVARIQEIQAMFQEIKAG